MKKSTALLLSGSFLVLVGAAIGYRPFMVYLEGKQAAKPLTVPFSSVVQAAPVDESNQIISGRPQRIQIASVGIDLIVAEGYFNEKEKTWTLSKDKAHYAVNTPLANNREGNTFIYGHNRKDVFRKLSGVKAGDEAVITTDNGHTFIYRFKAAYETNPNDATVFHYQGPSILTVQTCSGMRFENRQLFTFTFDRNI